MQSVLEVPAWFETRLARVEHKLDEVIQAGANVVQFGAKLDSLCEAFKRLDAQYNAQSASLSKTTSEFDKLKGQTDLIKWLIGAIAVPVLFLLVEQINKPSPSPQPPPYYYYYPQPQMQAPPNAAVDQPR